VVPCLSDSRWNVTISRIPLSLRFFFPGAPRLDKRTGPGLMFCTPVGPPRENTVLVALLPASDARRHISSDPRGRLLLLTPVHGSSAV